jgi:prepilin-type N-terminal cleavage/methylation domain-containing protein
VRKRFVKEQDGFTLPEMMITMVIMIVVLFALYSIFDMSIRVFSFGNDKSEAVQNARLGLEKMEREIRAAYPVNGPTSTGTTRYRFFDANGTNPPSGAAWPTATQITFGNELGSPGDRLIRCPDPPASCEYITYKLTSTGDPSEACTTDSAPCTLRRVNEASSVGPGEPVVEFVKPNGLRFRYFTLDGTEINPTSPGSFTTQDIGRVEIALHIDIDDRSQDLTTVVDLRNRGKVS